MNEKKYLRISGFFNNILKNNSLNVNFVGLTFLHLIRPQKDLIEYANKFNFKYRFFYHLKYTLKKIIGIFFYKKKDLTTNTKVDIAILSHLTNHQNLHRKQDLYFGNLQYFLKKNKKTSIKIYRNLTSCSSASFNNKKKNIIILQDFDKLSNEIKFFFF